MFTLRYFSRKLDKEHLPGSASENPVGGLRGYDRCDTSYQQCFVHGLQAQRTHQELCIGSLLHGIRRRKVLEKQL